jgi:hypothetical protein
MGIFIKSWHIIIKFFQPKEKYGFVNAMAAAPMFHMSTPSCTLKLWTHMPCTVLHQN